VVSAPPAGAICIPQSQHALISGQIAAAWGNGEFPAPEPKRQVEIAARRHDDGMDGFDAEPELDPDTGLPRSFMRMPVAVQVDCWRRGPSLVAAESAYAGILVSLHGSSLIGRRRLDPDDIEGRELVDGYLADQRTLREGLRQRAVAEEGVGEEELNEERLEVNRRLLAAWDRMSLAICMPRLPDDVPDVPAAGGGSGTLRMEPLAGGRVAVGPWPFAVERVAVGAEGRPLERRFSDEGEMRAELAGAEPVAVAAELVPAG
jgi:hypothetical protein